MKIFNWKILLFMLFMLLLAAAGPLFAADLMPSGMKTLADNILETFTGAFVKTIMIIILVGCAIAYAYNKDNEKMKMKILTLLVAIGIIVGAQWIVGAIWGAAG